ncbi:hypothetical protein [Methylocystis parvus]|uniref:hypothetical protein n=1 Tax=Methylocystis parvus TaxID=134 RepID=UPI003C76479C
MSRDLFKPGETCRTRNGKRARVICVDAKGRQSIVALMEKDGEESPVKFCHDGTRQLDGRSGLDLIPNARDRAETPPRDDAAALIDHHSV